MIDLALEAVMAGGNLLRQKFGGRLDVVHKGEVDLVTDADRGAEAAIVEVIRGRYPNHTILAEEADYGPTSDRGWRWIIDPLDGTTNFAHGFPWFAVSLGLERAGKVILGIVYNPIFEELFVAERGSGATLNGQRLQVSTTRTLDQALLATGFPYDRKQSPVNNYDHFVNFQQAAQACRRPGAASLDLACTAAGRFDGYWEMKLKPWDMAAGSLLVTEAGGRISDFAAQRFDLAGAECLASNGYLHDAMIKVLQQGRRP